MCASSLLDSEWGDVTVSMGELAHNIGATDSARSPRGQSTVPIAERNRPDNLLLLCHGCHRKVDSADNQSIYTVEVLREIKTAHEDMVTAATDFATQHRTLVVVTDATVRGTAIMASHRQIAHALIASGRAPYTVDGRQVRVVIDLVDSESDPWVWERGCARIDEAVAKLSSDTASGAIDHVSIFVIAPIPLLTYLGHELDDKYGVEVYRRARIDSDKSWCWPDTSPTPIEFTTTIEQADRSAGEAVVMVSVSGNVTRDRVPSTLAHLPILDLRPSGVTPNLDALPSRTDLMQFSAAWRALLAKVERELPGVRNLHVLAAVPAPAAVNMGRYRSRSVSPTFTMYQRTDNDTFAPVVEITE